MLWQELTLANVPLTPTFWRQCTLNKNLFIASLAMELVSKTPFTSLHPYLFSGAFYVKEE
jgi:hypothetical protein